MGNRVSKNAPRGLILTGSDPALIQSVLTPHAWTSSEEELAKNGEFAQLTYENQVYASPGQLDRPRTGRSLSFCFSTCNTPAKIGTGVGPCPVGAFSFAARVSLLKDAVLAFFVAQLGKGSFGNVQKMRHKLLNKVFAVKKIRDSMDPQERKQLITEMVVLQKSNCPSIIQSYGFGCAEVCLFLCCSCVSFLVVVGFLVNYLGGVLFAPF